MKFRDNVIRFMGGRYGGDKLGTAITVLCFALITVNIFVRSVLLYAIVTALLAWSIYRTMSRRIYDRQKENEIFLGILSKVKGRFRLLGKMWRDRRTHVYRVCPGCKKTLRLPREKGRHTVCCPCCHKDFSCTVH